MDAPIESWHLSRMIPDPPPPLGAPTQITTDRCASRDEVASSERRYLLKDRLARGLFSAICRSMGVEPYARSASETAPIYVTADAATHARLWARYAELMPLMDDRVLSAASDFIRECCGIEMPPAPRR